MNGLCNDCYRSNQITYKKCESPSCSSFANVSKNDGYCDKCVDRLKQTSSKSMPETKTFVKNYEKCSTSTCEEPATQNGYCTKCIQIKYNSSNCKMPTCMNAPTLAGYCLECYVRKSEANSDVCKNTYCKNQSQVKDGYCESCYNILKPPKFENLYNCTAINCPNYIPKNNSYCNDCLEKFDKLH